MLGQWTNERILVGIFSQWIVKGYIEIRKTRVSRDTSTTTLGLPEHIFIASVAVEGILQPLWPYFILNYKHVWICSGIEPGSSLINVINHMNRHMASIYIQLSDLQTISNLPNPNTYWYSLLCFKNFKTVRSERLKRLTFCSIK